MKYSLSRAFSKGYNGSQLDDEDNVPPPLTAPDPNSSLSNLNQALQIINARKQKKSPLWKVPTLHPILYLEGRLSV